jgi:hypothetical protein
MTPSPALAGRIETLGRQLLELAEELRAGSITPAPPRPEEPRPTTTAVALPPWLAEAAEGRGERPVPLQGTARQVAWAEKLRGPRIANARRRNPELVAAFSIIRDATWWIANDKTPVNQLNWPSPEQVEPTRANAAP